MHNFKELSERVNSFPFHDSDLKLELYSIKFDLDKKIYTYFVVGTLVKRGFRFQIDLQGKTGFSEPLDIQNYLLSDLKNFLPGALEANYYICEQCGEIERKPGYGALKLAQQSTKCNKCQKLNDIITNRDQFIIIGDDREVYKFSAIDTVPDYFRIHSGLFYEFDGEIHMARGHSWYFTLGDKLTDAEREAGIVLTPAMQIYDEVTKKSYIKHLRKEKKKATTTS